MEVFFISIAIKCGQKQRNEITGEANSNRGDSRRYGTKQLQGGVVFGLSNCDEKFARSTQDLKR